MSNVTFQSIVKTLDSNHAVDLRGGVRIPANVPAQYVGSDYWLWIGESNGNPMVWDNTPEELKCYNHPSGTNIWGETLIPIQNTNIGKMSFNLTAYPYASDHKISIFLYKIIDNVITLVKTVSEITTTVVNQNYEVSCDVDADYIGIKHAWFSQSIGIVMKNINFELAVSYAWQSVPSISGKNGILFLSTIQSVYLNNGDPVNNAPANYIQFADDSNVAILVGEQVDDPTLVTIQYIVPAGTYEYIKLVYKVDSAPTSITDGTAVNILQANRSVTISGIANGNTYFFKIFTDVSESEPYEFTTTKPPIASNYVFELDLSTDGKDIVRYDATKDIGNHKQGELYGSGISIEDGILTASSWIYWDYDGTENPKFIPANCTLTFEYDAFFPNGEGYLDWYVIDSSGGQQIYWCFDTQHAFQSNKWYNCKTVAKVQNGKIVRYKYVLDGNEISSNTADINMPCVNTETSLGISQIYFRLTRTTKFKNMSIYFDFSEYHDGGGSGSGSSGRA